MELASNDEKQAMEDKERKQKDFFAAMEANILASMSQGVVPGTPKQPLVINQKGLVRGPKRQTNWRAVKAQMEMKEQKCTCGVIDDYYANTFNCRKHGKGVRIDLRWPDPVDSDEAQDEKPTVKRERPATPTYEIKSEDKPEAAIDYKAKVWTWLANNADDE